AVKVAGAMASKSASGTRPTIWPAGAALSASAVFRSGRVSDAALTCATVADRYSGRDTGGVAGAQSSSTVTVAGDDADTSTGPAARRHEKVTASPSGSAATASIDAASPTATFASAPAETSGGRFSGRATLTCPGASTVWPLPSETLTFTAHAPSTSGAKKAS